MEISQGSGVRDQSSRRIKWLKFQSNKNEVAKERQRSRKLVKVPSDLTAKLYAVHAQNEAP